MDTTTNQSNQERFPLRRPAEGRMLAGVAAGLAGHFGLDVGFVRVVFVVLALLGGAGIPLYAAAWMLVPEAGSEVAIADQLLNHARSY